MKKYKIARLPIFLTICILVTAACVDSTNSVSLRGYNHMKVLAISEFTVNGAMGPKVDTESGGGETCCVRIPKRWWPGLKAKVSWSYDQNDDVESPKPESQTAEVDIPEDRFVGAVQVHFYDKHKIKIVIFPCYPRHLFYPMSPGDIAPWEPSGSKDEALEAAQRGGGSVDC